MDETEGFSVMPFPEDQDIVYVLSFRPPSSADRVAFYVGQSRRGTRRLAEYGSAQFAAATDFKVGTAVRALRQAGCEVFVSYKRVEDRVAEENRLIKRFSQSPLLNHEPSYNYRSASKASERARIEAWVQKALASSTTSDA
jgi:hypothetical protein